MSLTTFAIVNGILAIGILSALAYVCRLPFRLDRVRVAVAPEAVAPEASVGYEELAA